MKTIKKGKRQVVQVEEADLAAAASLMRPLPNFNDVMGDMKIAADSGDTVASQALEMLKKHKG